MTTASKRSMKQAADRRGACSITYSDQPADDLRDTKDASVDVVVSLQAMDRLRENGLDWKLSVREAARVLKPGGRLLFVEAAEVDGESYLDYLKSLINVPMRAMKVKMMLNYRRCSMTLVSMALIWYSFLILRG